MSRLDSFIRRLEAQRACIDRAAAEAPAEGVVFELGLGNGRTYDHLRERFPGREIFVFDRQVAAHPDCRPDDAHILLGDLTATLPAAARRFAARVAFAHCDLGSGRPETDRALSAFIVGPLDAALAPGGCVASDQPLAPPGWQALELPAGIAADRYFLYRKPTRMAPRRERAGGDDP